MIEPNTGYYATVVTDSINLLGIRLTTLEICFPRFILAEFNTHRKFSRNSASSRAIPVSKQLERIKQYPFVPAKFPINKPGMSASEYIGPEHPYYAEIKGIWLRARDDMVEQVGYLLDYDVHKQTANRLLEPFMWHTVVVSATEWENFFNLRISEYAQPEIRIIAEMMKTAMDESVPTLRKAEEWHLPYVDPAEHLGESWEMLAKISSGRCAAVTLLNQQNKNPEKDITRTDGLILKGHMTPLEHPAMVDTLMWPIESNFDNSWVQYRKMIPNEAVYDK